VKDVDCIRLDQDRVHWWVLNMVMNLCVPCNMEGFLMWLRSWELLKKDLACSMKLVSTNSLLKLVLFMVFVGTLLLADSNFYATRKFCILSITLNIYY
jgi:hypothetical protein